jgi:hypothetical protein
MLSPAKASAKSISEISLKQKMEKKKNVEKTSGLDTSDKLIG